MLKTNVQVFRVFLPSPQGEACPDEQSGGRGEVKAAIRSE
jgi:hypothetical protein